MKNLFIVFASFLSLSIFAQQQEHFSMYMQNNFLVNPAEGGTDDFIDLKLGYRTQWIDFDDRSQGTPKTFFLSGHAPIGKHETKLDGVAQLPFHGVGGAIIRDQIGPFNITTVKAAYAYHLPVSKSLILSLGAFGGVKQFNVDQGKLQFDSQGSTDPFAASFKTTIVPDVSLGVWGYSKKLYFGVASFQLLNNRISLYKDIANQTSDSKSTLNMHHWVTAGYKINIDSNFFIVPSFVVKYVVSAPVTFDLNAKFRYQDKFWIGVSYRRQDAIVAIAGVTLKKLIDIAYSFDITSSNVKNYNSGTHEFVVGLRLPNHQHHPPAAQFW